MPDVIVDQQTTSPTSEDWRNSASRAMVAFSFLTSEAHTLTRLDVTLARFGTVSGNITLEVWSDSAGDPGSLITNGASNTTLDASTLPVADSNTFFTFTFSTNPSLSNATTYWVVFSSTVAINASNFVTLGMSTVAGSVKVYTDDNMVTPFTQTRTSIIGAGFKTYKALAGGGFSALSPLLGLA